MSDFEKYLPKPKAAAKVTGIMIRPGRDICDWLETVANENKCSVNQVCVAIITAAMEKSK